MNNSLGAQAGLDTAGYWILDTGYWMLDAGYWILDTGYWILDTILEHSTVTTGTQ